MKTKQEQIEEMGKVIPEKIKDPLDNSRYIIFGKSLRREIARIYYNAGYQKADEVRKETAKEIYGLAVDYYDGSEAFDLFLQAVKERYGVEVEE